MACCICTGFKTSSLSIGKVSPTVNRHVRGWCYWTKNKPADNLAQSFTTSRLAAQEQAVRPSEF